VITAEFLFPFVSDYICGAIKEGKPFFFTGRSGNAQIGIKTSQKSSGTPWVIEKSVPSILILELKQVMQEVHVGKPRRDALTDFSNKYQIPDLSTFTRALVQADRMGTSVADALNIISEDMRISRFRRGEQIALKAPLKMLVPLLLVLL